MPDTTIVKLYGAVRHSSFIPPNIIINPGLIYHQNWRPPDAGRFLTQNSEAQIRSLMEKISTGLDNLDFTGKQELLRLLVEKVFYNGQGVEILSIIPLSGQLHPIHRGG